ncbi:MAG: lysine biosynthesis protein LysW [Gemmatimonadales bacterium]|uniref:lysine biosynthesis protein LysW n=1 Tax=Candidatus Palauibacter TaxID=3056650 RepID=UPI0013843BC3|nr:lysine biosynthesis protein LysW [Candidatus Palauibacter polyketidifaciens]MXX69866.1 lysine biosynthesis protein LysW [Gemmatimonadales bacterium]MDE2719228.1 lysine biosynthesis protein LysW [Candidatus Palauibacter polyketidifaciens]MYE35064.1 lysine biosynthesis protein LysW [Gemmatimonadales bacterium]MYG19048.1 lysine biosynthesis protein LysW [Gemmatimonadales bacterium]MYH11060.1 lysine biosynthesis protein LysW [Gemmatimonadales bacterium]
MPECPVCGAEPTISDDPVEGELLECEECGVELEILALDPITLGEAPDAEEDWGE